MKRSDRRKHQPDRKQRNRKSRRKCFDVAREKSFDNDLCNRRSFGNRSDRSRVKHVKIGEMNENIQDYDNDRSADERNRNIFMRFFNFSRYQSQIIPAVITPQRAEHCRAESCNKRISGRTVFDRIPPRLRTRRLYSSAKNLQEFRL
ncbi:hypothetical protein Bpfe_031207 [Biomphalaria pfeifferi]|uniref:Uncharacterized protein n=1 Tax=Biomphalaria pfeifferi TaxID=112525 RepID=A0AAD8ANA2_BIOPF|nr:hypothetical protein Bpfe_031207 [Biomphalaria pfeifferi]